MYPYDVLFGMDLYELLLAAAAVCAMLVFRYFSDRMKLDVKWHNFILVDAIVCITGGYLLAVAVQAVYNWLDGDGFAINNDTGATFLGGLVGGAGVFLLFYFAAGHFVFKDGLHLRMFPLIQDIGAVCIPAAHCLGRIGCLMAGCCYGRHTDAWYGIKMVYLGYKVVPTQLFEAVFLALLALALGIALKRGKRNLLGIYMASYGVWRFFIEYLRDDDRGSTFVSFLTPSQLTSLLLIAGGAAVFLIMRSYYAKKAAENAEE